MIHNILAAIDQAAAPEGGPVKRTMGRRLLLGAGLAGAAAAGFSRVTGAAILSEARREAPAVPNASLPSVIRLDHARIMPCDLECRDWLTFRARFVQPDGRIIDDANQSVSHTESQGLGMLFAVAFDDRETFDRIWNWTSIHLRRPGDALFSWRYVPGAAKPVADINNATDGDIYIAAALARASCRWGVSGYLRASQRIASAILGSLVRQVGHRTVLLPGIRGFEASDHVVVNASYYVFPLLADLAQAVPSETWGRLIADGHAMIAEAQFGMMRLPPDWLRVSTADGSLSLSQDQPPRFSFDAVRIPLFLTWTGRAADSLLRFTAFWGSNPGRAPAWIDLRTGAHASYTTCGGVVAIARLASRAQGRPVQAELPAITPGDNYYSAALILLSRLALRETESRTA